MLSVEYFTFFKELEQNNTKEWFEANKKRFELHVKQPFYGLVDAVIQEVQRKEPELDASSKNCVFRIYRDIRFSKDKTPYKTHMAAHITSGKKDDGGMPGLYFQIGSNGGSLGGGVYQPTKDQLTLVRDLILHEGQTLHKLLKSKVFLQHFPDGLIGEKNKVLPADFREAAKKEPLLYNKQFLWWTSLSADTFMDNAAHKTIAKYYFASKPIKDFFAQALA